MTPIVAVIAMGEMGAGLASLMVESKAQVRTYLVGRSNSSFERARKAGVEIVDSEPALLSNADFFLSIVPPAIAKATAKRYAPLLRELEKKPVYVDCNAVSPYTVHEVGRIIEESGAEFVDACLLGNAPAPGRALPRMFLSGSVAQKVLLLSEYGLVMKSLKGEIGQASALKCAYAALGKGITAIAAWSVLGAQQNGVIDTFADEVAQYQPQLAPLLAKMLPEMFPKANRWVAEMEEIGSFLSAVPGGEVGFKNISSFYDAIAKQGRDEAVGTDTDLVRVIKDFLATKAIGTRTEEE